MVNLIFNKIINCDTTDAIYCMNIALCYIQGFGVKKSWAKAFGILNKIEKNQESCIDWWSKEKIVGVGESNLVLALLEYCGIKKKTDIKARLINANNNGFNIPQYWLKKMST